MDKTSKGQGQIADNMPKLANGAGQVIDGQKTNERKDWRLW
ncbi:hypothetical protein ACEQPO_13740 [Bacillus sp. SL00103]